MEYVLIAAAWILSGLIALAYSFHEARRLYPIDEGLGLDWCAALMIAALYTAFGPIAAMHAITFKVIEKIRAGWPGQ